MRHALFLLLVSLSFPLEGGSQELKTLMADRVVILNFWATWCVPCRAEMRALQKLYEKYEKEGLTVISISRDGPQSEAQVTPFVKANGFTFPVFVDRDQAISNKYGVSACPTTFVIDRQGRTLQRSESYQEGDGALYDSLVGPLLMAAPRADSASTAPIPPPQPMVDLRGSNFLRANAGKEDPLEKVNAGWLEDWFDVGLARGGLSYQIRFRAYQFLRDNPLPQDNTVSPATHRMVGQRLTYESVPLTVEAGNLYANLGRGLLLRTYEDRLGRIDKDLNGLLAKGSFEGAEVGIFGGKVFDRFNQTTLYVADANEEAERRTFLQGGWLSSPVWHGARLSLHGMEAMRSDWDAAFAGGEAALAQGPAEFYLGYTGVRGEDKFNYPNNFTGRALYASLSGHLRKWSGGAEYKYYHHYAFDFTDPPNLVKFHTFRLMARNLPFANNTHEEGYQLRTAYQFSDAAYYAFNGSFLETHPERDNRNLVFHVPLPYIDLDNTIRFPIDKKTSLLADFNVNLKKRFEFIHGFEEHRAFTEGMILERRLSDTYNLTVETEYQYHTRAFREFLSPAITGGLGEEGRLYDRDRFHGGVLSLTLGRAGGCSLNADYERSTDAEETQKSWASGSFTMEFAKSNRLSLWAGQRKERVICSGGTCRVEPAFQGLELTMTSVF